ncbi:MAG TPA: carbon-nitrogen hydrolase family protein [Acidobacteriota bacterium]|nr:carbon-nitrogen hydrolase family protein [Acidobacteriota bacterium]
MLVKIVAAQARMGQSLTLEEKIYIFKQRPDFVCLPEYYLLDESVRDYHRAALRKTEFLQDMETLSDQLSTCLVGGTVVEAEDDRLYNSCFVFNRGLVIGRYRKRFPVPGEVRKGIAAGSEKLVVDVEGVRIGVLICGDVFNPALYSELGRENVDLVFVPTTSPFRPADSRSRKVFRDWKYFVCGAVSAGAYVVKVCGVGAIFETPLQGRSLIAAPWGIITGTDFAAETERRILSVTLDLAELREFRTKLRARQERKAISSRVPPSGPDG